MLTCLLSTMRSFGTDEWQARGAYSARTVYVGNLSFVTTDTQLHALFSRCGPIDKVVMGVNKVTMKPCGFAFVIFWHRSSVVAAVSMLSSTLLDERVIKVQADKGYNDGR